MSRTKNIFGPTPGRQLSALLTLLLCTVFVVPLPSADFASSDSCSVDAEVTGGEVTSGSVHNKGGLPFPCQNRPCGCRSADSCLRKCCCFTSAQKVAWAKAQARNTTSNPAPNTTTTAATESNGTRWHSISFIQSMECQGLGIAKIGFVVALTVPETSRPLPATPDVSPRPASDILPTASLQPPVPPPKLWV